MTLEQIVKLLDAGYTKEDIQKLQEPESEPKPEPDPEPKPEPTPEPKPKPEPEQNAVVKELQELKKAVYAMNIMQSKQPDKASADDILAKVLKEG